MKNHIYATSIISILLFQMVFIRLPYISFYNNVIYSCIVVIGLYLLIHTHAATKNSEGKALYLLFFLYLLVTLILSYINRHNTQMRNPFLSIIVYSAILFDALFLMRYLAMSNQFYQMIHVFYYLALFYVMLTDTLIFLKPSLFITYDNCYFIGDKFTVSFFHLFLTVLFVQKCRVEGRKLIHEKLGTLLYLYLTLVISVSVHCSTGIVGTVLVFILFFFPEKFLFKLSTFLTVMGVSAVILILYSQILTNNLFGISLLRFFIKILP